MDKAIISAAVALFIFTLTQIFVHIRDRQTFLRGKLEELFEALNDVSEVMLDSLYPLQNIEDEVDREEIKKLGQKLNRALYKPRTLILLYFPYLVLVWEKAYITHIFEYTAYINEVSEGKKKLNYPKCMSHIQEFSQKIRWLQNVLSKNHSFTTQSLKFHLSKFLPGRPKLDLPPNNKMSLDKSSDLSQ